MRPVKRLISVSGGKDSTATLLLALERHPEEVCAVFADTGNEHELTIEYLNYLREALGIQIHTVRANFSSYIEGKRKYIEENWRKENVAEDLVIRALNVLEKPTGNPYLDLCLWKGRFPSRKAQFCTQYLKKIPLSEFTMELMWQGFDVESWQGVRWDESKERAKLTECEDTPEGIKIVRPILSWTVEEVFAMHRKHGVKPNPLYTMGMSRVGCMPCINARKSEVREIAKRFPDHVERIAEWEELVSQAAKRGMATFFNTRALAPEGVENEDVTLEDFGIKEIVQWSRTKRGGKQLLMDFEGDAPGCSSMYGLCE